MSYDNIPRRCKMEEWEPAELYISEAIVKVEEMGAHELLTDAVILLSEAQSKIADYIDSQRCN